MLKYYSITHKLPSPFNFSTMPTSTYPSLYLHLTGRVSEADSLFYYLPGQTYSTFMNASFTPRFYEDLLANLTAAQLQIAVAACVSLSNKECLYDFMITGQQDVAASTLATNNNNAATSTNLG